MSHWFILLFREKKHRENHKCQWAQIWRICHWCLNRSRVTSIWLYFIRHTANNCVQNVCQWRKKAYKWILSCQPLKDYISASTMSRSSDIKYLITKDLARKRYKSNISTTKGPKTTKICKEPTYYWAVSPIIDKKKLGWNQQHDPMKEVRPVTIWSHGLPKSCDILNTLHLRYYKAYGYQTWESSDLQWRVFTCEATKPFQHVVA